MLKYGLDLINSRLSSVVDFCKYCNEAVNCVKAENFLTN